jgi:transcription termination factor NusB
MTTSSLPPRKRQNASEKRTRAAAEVQLFAKHYSRPAQKGVEPNDRRYDTKIEKRIKQMTAEDLDHMLRFEEE